MKVKDKIEYLKRLRDLNEEFNVVIGLDSCESFVEIAFMKENNFHEAYLDMRDEITTERINAAISKLKEIKPNTQIIN